MSGFGFERLRTTILEKIFARPRWGGHLVWYALATLPLVCLIFFVARYGVDIPYRDEWALTSYLKKLYQGTLSLPDLWAQHNNHRMLFPRLVLLPLITLTGWNMFYEIAANILLATALFALLIFQMKRTKSSRGITGSSFVVPALALLIFSLKQSENWLMGFQVAFFLNVVTLTAGIILLARSGFSWWRFLAAVLLGVVASYSTINGLLYWFVALPVLLTLPFQNPRTRRICIMLWLLAAVVVINSYFYNYQTPPSKTPGNFALTHPTEFATYFLCYLGNPVGPNHILATALAGLFGLFILFVTAVLLVRARYLSLQQLAPYLSLAFYSIGSALFTTISRAGYGVLQAKVSRYVTFANLLWAAVFILLYLLVTISMAESRKSTAPRRRKRAVAAAALIAFLGIVLAAGQSSVKSVPVFRDWRAQLAPARAALLSTRDPELLRPIYPRDPNMPIRQIPFLEEHRLSVFREAQYGADTD